MVVHEEADLLRVVADLNKSNHFQVLHLVPKNLLTFSAGFLDKTEGKGSSLLQHASTCFNHVKLLPVVLGHCHGSCLRHVASTLSHQFDLRFFANNRNKTSDCTRPTGKETRFISFY